MTPWKTVISFTTPWRAYYYILTHVRHFVKKILARFRITISRVSTSSRLRVLAVQTKFQTLPGVILHFYILLVLHYNRKNPRFKPFQGLFCISTYSIIMLYIFSLWGSFKPFQGLFYISTGNGQDWPKVRLWFQTLPGVILHFYAINLSSFLSAQNTFQTLPGVILHFYPTLRNFSLAFLAPFQTLPGVILHFYLQTFFMGCRVPSCVSNPSRGYSTFLRQWWARSRVVAGWFQTLPGVILHFYAPLEAGSNCNVLKSFKPFQGLFYISTHSHTTECRPKSHVSNPSRGYSTFLHARH